MYTTTSHCCPPFSCLNCYSCFFFCFFLNNLFTPPPHPPLFFLFLLFVSMEIMWLFFEVLATVFLSLSKEKQARNKRVGAFCVCESDQSSEVLLHVDHQQLQLLSGGDGRGHQKLHLLLGSKRQTQMVCIFRRLYAMYWTTWRICMMNLATLGN